MCNGVTGRMEFSLRWVWVIIGAYFVFFWILDIERIANKDNFFRWFQFHFLCHQIVLALISADLSHLSFISKTAGNTKPNSKWFFCVHLSIIYLYLWGFHWGFESTFKNWKKFFHNIKIFWVHFLKKHFNPVSAFWNWPQFNSV